MPIKQYDFEDGKYQFFRNTETSEITEIRRSGVIWGEGLFDLKYSKCIHAMLNRIDELEKENSVLKAVTGNC